MAESKFVQINFEDSSCNVCGIIFSYVFSMLSLGRILISDYVVADLFMDLLFRYDSTLLDDVIFHKGVFA